MDRKYIVSWVKGILYSLDRGNILKIGNIMYTQDIFTNKYYKRENDKQVEYSKSQIIELCENILINNIEYKIY